MTYISDNVKVESLEQELFVNNLGASYSAARLSMMDKILHLIITWTIRLVPTKHSSIFREDIWFIHHIKL